MNPEEIKAAMTSLTDQRADDELKRALEKVQQNPLDAKDLLQLQMALQKQQMAMQLQSNIIKKLEESLSNIIQKM